jgi:hypothetical protein
MAYTGQQLVNDVRALVIEPMPAFFSTARMVALIDLSQKEYVRRTKCLETFAFTSSVQGQSQYPLPANYISSLKVFYNNVFNGVDNWLPMNPTWIEKLAQEFPNFLTSSNSAQQIPNRYYIYNQILNLFPTPMLSGSNNVFMFYECSPQDYTDTTFATQLQIPDVLYPGVKAYMMWMLWLQDGEDQKAAAWQAIFETEVGRGLAWRKRRQIDSRGALDIQSYQAYNYNTWNSVNFAPGINPLNQ